MPRFSYQGTGLDGKAVSGSVEALDKTTALQQIAQKNITVTKIRSESIGIKLRLPGTGGRQGMCDFTNDIATMLEAGHPLTTALQEVGEGIENNALRKVAAKIHNDVTGGSSLAESMARHPGVFDKVYCAMVRVAEAGGLLPQVLKQLAEHETKSQELRQKVRAAASYPVMLAIVTLVGFFFLTMYAVPKVTSMFGEMGVELPLPTQIVMAVSEIMQKWGWALVVLLVGGIVVIKTAYAKNERFAFWLDGLKINAPIIGNVGKKAAIARFTRTLSALRNSDVAISQAMEVTAETAGNRAIRRALLHTLDAVNAGEPMADPLKKTGLFPPMVTRMVKLGEETGELATELERIADRYEKQVDSAVAYTTTMLQPLLLIIMGIVIGGFLVAMYMPMWKIIRAIG